MRLIRTTDIVADPQVRLKRHRIASICTSCTDTLPTIYAWPRWGNVAWTGRRAGEIATMVEDMEPYVEAGDDYEGRYGDFESRLVYSKVSGHARFDPPPSAAFLDDYYNGGFSEGGNEVYNLESQYSPAVIETARGVRAHMMQVAKLDDAFKYHDFGCAFGNLVYGFQQIGVQATGNEPNESWVAAGNEFCGGALTSQPLDVALGSLPYSLDLITALHVVEHLVDPLAALRTIREKLSPKGVVYICVPNGHLLQYALGGRRKDPNFSFPMHQQYFTAKSMIAYLREAGLEPFQMETRWLPDGHNGVDYVPQQILGCTKSQLVNFTSFTNAMCQNMLGGELFVLAGLPSNCDADRDPDIDIHAEKAFALVQAMRTEREKVPA